MNKKAIHMTEIAVIIIAAVVLMLLIYLATKISWGLKNEANDEICRESMIIHSKLSKNTEGLFETNLECPANHYEFKDKRLEEINYKIAQELKKCWYKTLGKENRLWFNDWSSGNYDWTFVCSSFEIYGEDQVKEDINTLDLSLYLNELDPKTKRPYIDFLDTDWKANNNKQFFGTAIDKGSDDVEMVPLDKIKLSTKEEKNTYLVLFIMYSKNGFWVNSIDLNSGYYDITNTIIKQYDFGIDWLDSDESISFHTIIIPQEDLLKFKINNLFWQRENE